MFAGILKVYHKYLKNIALNIPKEVIRRKRYVEAVAPFIDQQLIKAISGQRRVGKSYLLYQLMEYLREVKDNPHILYINMEDINFSFLKSAEDLHRYVIEKWGGSERCYVFIDEVQDIDNFQSSLRSLLLNESLDIYCTG
ncbi:MAG: hypothetical protein EA409_06635, partial [Saprospirales bacterium]